MTNEGPHEEGDAATVASNGGSKRRPAATRFILRGLAISLPPILTIAILIWLVGLLNRYIITPTSTVVQYTIAQFVENDRPTDQVVAWNRLPPLPYIEQNYRVTPALKEDLQERLANEGDGSETAAIPAEWVSARLDQVYVPFGRRAVPYDDYQVVASHTPDDEMPRTSTSLYMNLVTHRYFQSFFNLSAVAVVVVVIGLYFLGGFVTARMGSWIVHKFESGVLARLPVISNVYSSVKQVTDFFFAERTLEYNRVVAVEYPRRGMWSIGFVTGDSLLELTGAAGEPLVSVLMPTSPMPMTGFTVNLPRREVVDLNITLDQAFQFCLSCGVLVPPQQRVTPELLQQELTRRLTAQSLSSRYPPRPGPDGDAHPPQAAAPHSDHHSNSPPGDQPQSDGAGREP